MGYVKKMKNKLIYVLIAIKKIKEGINNAN